MANSLTDKNISATYKSLLKTDVGINTDGISASLAIVDSGAGTNSALSIGTNQVLVKGTGNSTTAFEVKDASDKSYITVDNSSTPKTVTINDDNENCNFIVKGDTATKLQITDTKVEVSAADLEIDETKKLFFDGGSDTYIHSSAPDVLKLLVGDVAFMDMAQDTSSTFVINEGGVDMDFRVESAGNANMLFVDGGNNRVGVGTAPSSTLHIKGGTNVGLARFEESGGQYLLFRHYDGTADAGIDDGSGTTEYTPTDGSFGIYQAGTGYKALHLGRAGRNTVIACDETVVPDAEMPYQSFSFYISGGDLKVRVRNSSGTLTTGTIDLT